MTLKQILPRLFILLVLTPFVLPGPPGEGQAADYEKPPVFKVGDLVSRDLLAGDHHKINSRVVNDGYMNRFTIQSDFGTFEAPSEFSVPIRVKEINSLADLKELSRTKVFVDALGDSVKRTADSAVKIASDPVGTAKALPGGVSRYLKRLSHTTKEVVEKTGEAMSGDQGEAAEGEKGQAEEAARNILGVNRAKRQLAQKMGIDPYTTNEPLQAELNRLANAAFLGGVAMDVAVPVPKALNIADAVVGQVGDLVYNTNPTDLEVTGREKLQEMGAPEKDIDAFYENRWYTITGKTALVVLLEKMENVKARDLVVKLADRVEDHEQSSLFLRSMDMLSRYHHSRNPL